ncbi:bifunctional 3-(3-hydroxy-phenyl)propionate/3-hydroxycinnamic acid hydroxylase [Bradyrhizobium sp.]|uniref:bifunctional 3-(3-hydroxy-phenyl)propionate/3-hydroxycinnamic acid hydroxylase n=1 Tax=Bradyrhizobium sp. TaxID=376 RepID=UPI0039E51ECE
MQHFDAVISGCGPTGGALANLLAAQGLSVCVVERFPEVYPTPRAIVLDWEAMRALQYCGVAHALFPSTRPHPGTDFLGVDGEIIKLFDPAPPPYALGWPSTSTFVQPELEKMLRRALSLRANVTMKLGCTVADFSEETEGVTVTIADNATGAREAVTSTTLIGCDGANSEIRKRLGFGLEDYRFDEWWIVVDAWQLCDTDLPRKTTQYCWPSRPATYVVGPGNLRRWEIKLLPHESPADFEDPARLREVMAKYVDIRCFDIWRSATYRFAARVGDRWASRRVFLAGDAVHQMPPFLGQGLCAGLRDAFNLAWKLVFAQRHGWSDALLATYETERKPHVATVIQHAKEFGLIIGEMDEARAIERDRTLRAELREGRMTTTRQAFIPNLAHGILGDTPLSGSLMVQPEIVGKGRTRLMDDLCPMAFLYVTTDSAAQAWMEPHAESWRRLGGHRIVIGSSAEPTVEGVLAMTEAGDTFAKWAAAGSTEAVIVRPDRYVYASIQNENDLANKLARLNDQLGFAD